MNNEEIVERAHGYKSVWESFAKAISKPSVVMVLDEPPAAAFTLVGTPAEHAPRMQVNMLEMWEDLLWERYVETHGPIDDTTDPLDEYPPAYGAILGDFNCTRCWGFDD
jgi:hypothetical protein